MHSNSVIARHSIGTIYIYIFFFFSLSLSSSLDDVINKTLGCGIFISFFFSFFFFFFFKVSFVDWYVFFEFFGGN